MEAQFHPKKMLVTGGAGFIGSHFIEYMFNKYDDLHIVNLDLLTYAGSLKNTETFQANTKYNFVQGDICDSALVHGLLREHEIDTIVHFAAESHVDRSIAGPDAFIQTNIVGTHELLKASRQVWLEENKWNETRCRFHHISTDEVYGSLGPDDSAFTEETPYSPNSPYSASKASSDHLLRAYQETFGLPTTLSNCSNNYGLRQHAEKLIPTIIRSCLESRAIPVYGDGKNIRDWLHVQDHCRAIDLILRFASTGDSFNVGGGEEICNIDLVSLIIESVALKTGATPDRYRELITFVPDRLGHDFRYAIDCKKLKEKLGWEPQETLGSSLDVYLTEFAKAHELTF